MNNFLYFKILNSVFVLSLPLEQKLLSLVNFRTEIGGPSRIWVVEDEDLSVRVTNSLRASGLANTEDEGSLLPGHVILERPLVKLLCRIPGGEKWNVDVFKDVVILVVFKAVVPSTVE